MSSFSWEEVRRSLGRGAWTRTLRQTPNDLRCTIGGMDGDVDIAPVAALLGDPARAAIVGALDDGRALPAGELARRAAIAPSTASEHLARLVDGGLLEVERGGRHRYFRIAGSDVARAVEALAAIEPRRPVRSLNEANRASALAEARTCYDHLAGRLGVALGEALVARRVLTPAYGGYAPGARAASVLAALGIDLDEVRTRRRPFALRCLDWSERRPHVAGALGAALAVRALEERWVERRPGSRALRVTAPGRSAMNSILGLEL
jgi:DNA-binding transcriptional ArsR family regulator